MPSYRHLDASYGTRYEIGPAHTTRTFGVVSIVDKCRWPSNGIWLCELVRTYRKVYARGLTTERSTKYVTELDSITRDQNIDRQVHKMWQTISVKLCAQCVFFLATSWKFSCNLLGRWTCEEFFGGPLHVDVIQRPINNKNKKECALTII